MERFHLLVVLLPKGVGVWEGVSVWVLDLAARSGRCVVEAGFGCLCLKWRGRVEDCGAGSEREGGGGHGVWLGGSEAAEQQSGGQGRSFECGMDQCKGG